MFLRERMKAIRKELGEEDEANGPMTCVSASKLWSCPGGPQEVDRG
jgi:hypothetical protein